MCLIIQNYDILLWIPQVLILMNLYVRNTRVEQYSVYRR